MKQAYLFSFLRQMLFQGDVEYTIFGRIISINKIIENILKTKTKSNRQKPRIITMKKRTTECRILKKGKIFL